MHVPKINMLIKYKACIENSHLLFNKNIADIITGIHELILININKKKPSAMCILYVHILASVLLAIFLNLLLNIPSYSSILASGRI